MRSEVKNCKIFNEFSKDEQQKYFSYSDKKVIHNIDTLYYTVALLENDNTMKNIEKFLAYLKDLKLQCTENSVRELPLSDSLVFKPAHFAIYEYCISLENAFDIFIASYLPNDKTPRITIQLRSIALWLDGTIPLVKQAYNTIESILADYEIIIKAVNVNRIDYAYHTNIIQSTTKYFSDKNMLKNLKTNLRIYQKVGKIGRVVDVDYLALGNRKSNSIFFRAYNKSKEVIEKNYKGFFIDYWFENKLISEFDYYCYKKAYEHGTCNGLLLGRVYWYIEYGHDLAFKDDCRKLIDSCYKNSDNFEFMESALLGRIPEVTKIVNIEYQTKRKFYQTAEKFINDLPCSVPTGNIFCNLFKIIENRKCFLDYLTSETVAFGKEEYCSWWKRIRSVKIQLATDAELQREYGGNIDKKKVKKAITSSIATLSVYINKCNNNEFTEDLSDCLGYFNDNDVNTLFVDSETGEKLDFTVNGYDVIKCRKNRQLKKMVEKGK